MLFLPFYSGAELHFEVLSLQLEVSLSSLSLLLHVALVLLPESLLLNVKVLEDELLLVLQAHLFLESQLLEVLLDLVLSVSPYLLSSLLGSCLRLRLDVLYGIVFLPHELFSDGSKLSLSVLEGSLQLLLLDLFL